MPRKPKQEKTTITVVVNGTPVAVVLHPPSGSRRSWYAYWNGLATSRSTGQRKLEDAIIVAENMVRNGGKQPTLADAVLSDDEFEAIQRAHFDRKTDPAQKERAEKTLASCFDAIAAFRNDYQPDTDHPCHAGRLLDVSAKGVDPAKKLAAEIPEQPGARGMPKCKHRPEVVAFPASCF